MATLQSYERRGDGDGSSSARGHRREPNQLESRPHSPTGRRTRSPHRRALAVLQLALAGGPQREGGSSRVCFQPTGGVSGGEVRKPRVEVEGRLEDLAAARVSVVCLFATICARPVISHAPTIYTLFVMTSSDQFRLARLTDP